MREVDFNGGAAEIDLALGEAIILCLSENPTTGFRWRVTTSDESIVTVTGSKFRPHSAAVGVGAGGQRLIEIQGRGAGTATLSCAYLRAWEGAASITRQGEIAVRVR